MAPSRACAVVSSVRKSFGSEPIDRGIKFDAKRKKRNPDAEPGPALEMEADKAERSGRLADVRKELEKFAASLPPLDDSALIIRQDRKR